ncbi:MAG TPA: hypothetical protein VFS00_23170, partial [Polyangiaceae bacterium]|nr:hypothetical protein [Polyangiaceae bacterium]
MKRLVTSPIILSALRKKLPIVLAAMAGAGAIFIAAPAQASGVVATYPKFVQDAADADTAPKGACNLCHASGSGPAMGTPFGDAIKAAGLKSEAGMTVEKMKSYLDDLEDSDGGGVDDVDELKAGTDPNDDGD